MSIYIQEENTFKKVLQSGLSLFLGSGFSVLSKDKKKRNLPCGKELLKELKEEFPRIAAFNDLSKVSTVLEKSIEKDHFKKYLTNRFTVNEYDSLYNNLVRINLKNIFSTNIDDLLFKIWDNEKNTKYYINNTLGIGELNDNLAINYFPVHGCVLNYDKEYIFSNIKIASAYTSQNGSWESLKLTVSSSPILFWGWSFNDSDIIEAIYSSRGRMVDDNTRKWIVLYKPENYEIEFYKSLNFSIIIASTTELLEYLGSIRFECNESADYTVKVPSKYLIPSVVKEASYPVTNFFEGDIPRWSYIFSGQIVRTHYYKKIADLIHGGKNIIVIGVPASGKTTLMMQLAKGIETEKHKHILYTPTLDEIRQYKRIIGNDKVIVFVDNCLNDYRGILELASPNIQIVGFERDSKYESIVHRLCENKFQYDLCDISEIDEQDITRIVESIPKSIYSGRLVPLQDKTIFEAIRKHTKVPVMEDRFVSALREMYSFDSKATELFLMISYVHSCGVPVSYDMVYSYLEEENYQKVYDDIKRVGKLITECYDHDFGFLGDINLKDQDYYKCRTRYLAELIIQKVPNYKLMRIMLVNFVQNVPIFKICRYDIFKSSAYDADLVTRYFTNYQEGMAFYTKCLAVEDSPFIYQQIALYASRKRKYSDAFLWIDKAKNGVKGNVFSIQNTHAIILFNANINKENNDGSVIATLHQSLEILQNCYENDQRKGFHAQMFGELVLKLYDAYGYNEVEKYVETANKWLENEMNSKNNGNASIKKMRDIRKKIEDSIINPNEMTFSD